jgi:hypothetical protein
MPTSIPSSGSTTRQGISTPNLDLQRAQFAQSRFLAMPIAGTIAWTAIGIAGIFLRPPFYSLVLFGATGAIFYLGLLVARFTGEDLLGKTRPGNFFDRLLLLTIAMAFLGYAIAIPFFLMDSNSLPLSVGILTGLMWVPFSRLIRQLGGTVSRHRSHDTHCRRMVSVPSHRQVVIPVIVVAVYLVTLCCLIVGMERKPL